MGDVCEGAGTAVCVVNGRAPLSPGTLRPAFTASALRGPPLGEAGVSNLQLIKEAWHSQLDNTGYQWVLTT